MKAVGYQPISVNPGSWRNTDVQYIFLLRLWLPMRTTKCSRIA